MPKSSSPFSEGAGRADGTNPDGVGPSGKRVLEAVDGADGKEETLVFSRLNLGRFSPSQKGGKFVMICEFLGENPT